jgi:hypothetical protein
VEVEVVMVVVVAAAAAGGGRLNGERLLRLLLLLLLLLLPAGLPTVWVGWADVPPSLEAARRDDADGRR